MNIPNSLSLSRIFGGAIIIILLIFWDAHRIWIGGLFFVFAFTDILDGYLARKRNQVSLRGALLDNTTDKCLILLPLIYLGFTEWVIPLLPIFIITIREVLVSLIRYFWKETRGVVTSRLLGKSKMWAEGGAVLFLILNLVGLGVPLLWLAATLAIVSGLEFFWKLPRKRGAIQIEL